MITYFLEASTILLACVTAFHAALTKRSANVALAWIFFILLISLFGPLLYLLLSSFRLRVKDRLHRTMPTVSPLPPIYIAEPKEPFSLLASLSSRLTRSPLLRGNHIIPLANGEAAYPEMLKGITSAKHSIGLSTYHFTNDRIGREFVAALVSAKERNVEIRVLVDGYGAFSAGPAVIGLLERNGVRVQLLSPLTTFRGILRLNHRYHRKLLVIDGKLAFAGGINLFSAHYRLGPLRDMHFKIAGPLVAEVRRVFAADWHHASGEALQGEKWWPSLDTIDGDVVGRAIVSDPGENFRQIHWVFIMALACARKSIYLVSPYFMPNEALLEALVLTAGRGVAITIIVPESNRPLIHWAMLYYLSVLAEAGCRIFFSGLPYDHSKLLVIDDALCIVGSSNWDSRSLKYNFEFDLECYSYRLARQLRDEIAKRTAKNLEFRYETWPLRLRLRNSLARLLAAYL